MNKDKGVSSSITLQRVKQDLTRGLGEQGCSQDNPTVSLRGQQRLRAAGEGGCRPFPRLWITPDCRNKTSKTLLPPLSSLGPVLPMPALGTQAVGQSQLSREARVVKHHPRAFSFPGENDPNTSHGVKIKPTY